MAFQRRAKAGAGALLAALLTVAAMTSTASADGRCGSVETRPWCDTSLSPSSRADLLIKAMEPDQRIAMLGGDDPNAGPEYTGMSDGIPALGIPPLYMVDGPLGVRLYESTAMPSSTALGATFNPGLARRYGSLVGNEARHRGMDLLFGPTIDTMRTPIAGRSFETMGEDPLLTSELAVPYIEGVQSQGVIATAKHFAGNNQEGYGGEDADLALPGSTALFLASKVKEGYRMSVDARIGERAMREIYLLPFEAAVKQAGVGAVMCAYNKVNTHYACENDGLLDGRLKKQWGFKGIVVADYLALHDPTLAVKAGTDLEPWPGMNYGLVKLKSLVETSKVTQAEIDRRARTYLTTLIRFGVFDRDAYVNDEAAIDWNGHDTTATQVSAQSLTLLRNNGVLPLSKEVGSVAMIGRGVDEPIGGGGSASMNPHEFTSPLASFTSRLGSGRITAVDGSDQAAAVEAAESSDVAIVFAGNFETEGMDRRCLSLECPPLYGDQDALIEAVAAANPKTIVVLETGAPILTPWRNDVAGLLAAWYPGQAPGPAIRSVLFGDRDPGGRLPVTFPKTESQIPLAGDQRLYPGINNVLSYKDGVNVGYRSYRMRGAEPAYPFGFGLSYTRFTATRLSRAKPLRGEFARVRTTIRNVGRRSGFAVPQIYLHLKSRRDGPTAPIRLAGFAKVKLKPGESRKVSIGLSRRDLSVYRPLKQKWGLATSCPNVSFGWSSEHIRIGPPLGNSARCRK